jgi:anthranilate synthase component I
MKDLPQIKIPRKPTYVNFANDIDFFELFKKIEKNFDNCYLFESLGEQSRSSRYSVIGFEPEHVIRAKQNTLYFDDQEFEVENPYYALREIVPTEVISRQYSGGLVGYMNYDAVNYIEPSVSVTVHDKFPQFMFGVYTDGLVLDTITNQLFYFYYTKNRLVLIQSIMRQTVQDEKLSVSFLGNTMSRAEHEKAVLATKEDIIAGLIFQCEVGFRSEYQINGDAMKIYQKLREVNPSPYMYYVKFGDKKLIGASPELLFSLTDGEAETHPLAGTIRRGETEAEDRRLARKLLNDKKEAAEHKMLVDMHRSDIGRICQFGTVKVRSLMDVKRFEFVQHIGSEVGGILKPDEDMFSGLAALFPGGVLSGTPKVETIKIIDEREGEARGPYGGAVGSFGFNGDCTFAIPIRTLFVSGNDAYTQTCSGIVYDSVPDAEYDEIERKLAGMKKTLNEFAI